VQSLQSLSIQKKIGMSDVQSVKWVASTDVGSYPLSTGMKKALSLAANF
jgi:hypothetical protein